MAALVFIIVIPVVLVLFAAIDGFVASTLWGWFVVPTFGAPQLSVAAAIGISLAVRALTGFHSSSTSGKDKTWGEVLTPTILTPIFALLVGWIVKSFL